MMQLLQGIFVKDPIYIFRNEVQKCVEDGKVHDAGVAGESIDGCGTDAAMDPEDGQVEVVHLQGVLEVAVSEGVVEEEAEHDIQFAFFCIVFRCTFAKCFEDFTESAILGRR